LEDREDCIKITEQEYEIYRKKTSTFQELVKMGTYEWNGETYELVRLDREFKDDKDIGTVEDQENTKPKFKNIFEDNEYDKAETSTNQEEIEK